MKRKLRMMVLLGLSQSLSTYASVGESVDQLLSLSTEDLMVAKVMIATNTEKALSKAPSVVTVITAEDIKATGATNLTDVLQSVPGLNVRENQFGFRPLVQFRGASATHTLIMVNGVPQRDLVWSTGIYWKGLTADMIDRVEIIRGPGSAMFGSDASAGVINVITKTAGNIAHSEAGARMGSFNAQTGWLQHGGEWNGLDVNFTAGASHTDGHNPSIAADGQAAKDKTAGTQASYAPGNAYYGYDSQDLRLSVGQGSWRLLTEHLRQSNVGIGLTGAGVLDPQTRGSNTRSDIALLYNNEQFANNWGINAELRYHNLDYTSGNGFQENPPGYRDATGAYPNGFQNLIRSAQSGYVLEANTLYSGLKTHAIRLGGGYNEENLYYVEQFINKGVGPDGKPLRAGGPLVDVSDTLYAFAPEKIRRIRYLYLQDVWTLSNDWELTVGARYDHYSDFGSTVNPRLALVWQSNENLVTKLMYGQAFRAPSYQELYTLTAATKPNPNLSSERTRTWDLLFSYTVSKDLKLGIDFYRFKQSNLIAADLANQFQNMGESTALGIELEAQWQAAKTLRITGNLTNREEPDYQFRAFSVPRQKAYLRTDWAVKPNWNWNVQANWLGKHTVAPGDSRAPLGAYTLVDTTLRYSPRKEWEFAASIRNLFDKDAREYTGSAIPYYLPLPGRNFYTEIRYKF